MLTVQPKTLAEFLGVPPPEPEEPSAPTSSLAATIEEIVDGKALGLALINSMEFRQYLVLGLRLGTLPGFATILGRLMDHAFGKPPDRVEHTGKDGKPIETITTVRRVVVQPHEVADEEAPERQVTH